MMTYYYIPNVLTLECPVADAIPLVLDSPHSGTSYPDDFRYAVPLQHLRGLEDTYVNELFHSAPQYGATWLEALFPRSYIDANRLANDIDDKLLDEDYPGAEPG